MGKKWKDKYHEGNAVYDPAGDERQRTLEFPWNSSAYRRGCHVRHPSLHADGLDCVLPYAGPSYFLGSLAEPLSCVVGTFHAMYHTTAGSCPPHGDRRRRERSDPGGRRSDGDGARSTMRSTIPTVGPVVWSSPISIRAPDEPPCSIPSSMRRRTGRAALLNTRDLEDADSVLMELSNGEGYDDVLVTAPVRALIEQADAILAKDGCLNFCRPGAHRLYRKPQLLQRALRFDPYRRNERWKHRRSARSR